MSKGLKLVEELKQYIYPESKIYKKLSIIETELKELEERREMMRRFNEACVPMILDNETEKKLKAIEIIKKSIVEMSNTKVLMSEYYRVVLALDQKEYDLLKEILNA